jgi:hypothetical protein
MRTPTPVTAVLLCVAAASLIAQEPAWNPASIRD